MQSRPAVSRLALGGGVALLSAFAFTHVACSGSSEASSGFPGNSPTDDSGIDAGGPPSSVADGSTGVGPPDATIFADGGGLTDASSAAEPVPTKILAVHASPNLYDFRLCFGESLNGSTPSVVPVPPYPDDPASPMPETNYPGVPVGGAALLPSVPLSSGLMTVYVIRAQALQARGIVSTSADETTCDRLICNGGSCLVPQFDYFALPPTYVAAPGGSLVMAIEGCLAASVPPGSLDRCGADWNSSSGNLAAIVGFIAPVPAVSDGGTLSLQLAQLSRSFLAPSGTPSAGLVTYVDPASDASVALVASTLDVADPLPGATQVVPLSQAGVPTAYFTLSTDGGVLTQSLASIQFFEQPAADPRTWFAANATWFVAVVGDPTDAAAPLNLPDGAPNPAFDGHGLHLIAYPER